MGRFMSLKYEVVRKMESVFKPFIKTIEDNSDDYAFYRGAFYVDSNGNIVLDLLASDINGVVKSKSLLYDPEFDRIFYGGKFSLKSDKEISVAIRELISKIEKINPPISKLYFEFTQEFKEGLVVPDSTGEEGEVVLYLIGTFNEDHNLCLQSTDCGILSKDWGKLIKGNDN